MKNTIKAFTLVEMLIVIVIIGILIASLMPRMQTAQGRARDVARKNDLSQIQTAIITSQSDRGAWPYMKWNTAESDANAIDVTKNANSGIPVSKIKTQLINAWMSEVPSDPNGSNDNFWLWTAAKNKAAQDDNKWQYIYMVWKRNGVSNAWFVLMAKTEVEWSSNWVVCSKTTVNDADKKLEKNKWYIAYDDDLAGLNLCTKVSKVWTDGCTACTSNTANCCYEETWELRYILVY